MSLSIPCKISRWLNSRKAMLVWSLECLVTVNDLWLYLTVPWVGLQFGIMVFPDHTHLLFQTRVIDFGVANIFIRTCTGQTLIRLS